MYPIIYLCQYEGIGVYFIPWVIILYYFISFLKLFPLWSLGALSVSSCDHWIHPHQCSFVGVFSTSLLPGTIRCSLGHLAVLILSPVLMLTSDPTFCPCSRNLILTSVLLAFLVLSFTCHIFAHINTLRGFPELYLVT